jgi:hypothetical protein
MIEVNKFTAYWAIVALGTLYSILKIREENGCEGTPFQVKRQCIDEDSVYLKGITPLPSDTRQQLLSKLESTLSYHEKAGIWKTCLILANVMVFFLYVYADLQPKDIIGLHIIATVVLYFYWNYMNYHHFRRLKQNGMNIAASLFLSQQR